jgi:nickel/cobalt exporter
MRRRLLLLAAAVVLAAAVPAVAHPMGNFSINHYARISPDSGGDLPQRGVSILYVIDTAEIPTVTEKQQLAADGATYLPRRGAELAKGLTLTIDGARVPLKVVSSSMTFLTGAGGLPTMRAAFTLRADATCRPGARDMTSPTPSSRGVKLTYRDDNYAGRTGWKEIVVDEARLPRGTTAVPSTAGGSTNPWAVDRSAALTHYPNMAAVLPPQDLSAGFMVEPSGAIVAETSAAEPATMTSSSSAATPRDAFTQAIARKRITPAVMALGLLIAFIFGCFHALSPGHGKAMVAAYLVGARGTIKHAFLLGSIVTITHTLGVFALGLITLFASQYIVPERLYPVLGAVSGASVCGVGVWLLYSRLRGLPDHHHHDDGHVHEHGHDHDHEHHYHTHEHEGWHTHDHETLDGAAAHFHSRDAHPEDGHGHEHLHDHTHGSGSTGEEQANTQERAHTHADARGGPGRHAHVGHQHHHIPEGPITARSLLALGISGGLVPCPSALVVLLSAIALHRVLYGLFLITAFSFGLASVLIAIGMVVVSAAHLFRRAPSSRRLLTALPVFSAAAIAVIGIVLVVQALGARAI